ncbi:MAG: winged helix-turn-helix transcriptional regulator [Bdellovibrionales bacterium]|nr:winged helix-turn-helix transcriptional regulator [Bdellovibrionales bacterium]
MQKACVVYGAPEPKIGGSESHIHVEFKNHEADMAEKLAKKAVLQDTGEKTHMKTHMKILEILSSNPDITITELARQIDKSESAVWRVIQKLQKEGYLKRIGPDKGGHWEVVKKDD